MLFDAQTHSVSTQFHPARGYATFSSYFFCHSLIYTGLSAVAEPLPQVVLVFKLSNV